MVTFKHPHAPSGLLCTALYWNVSLGWMDVMVDELGEWVEGRVDGMAWVDG